MESGLEKHGWNENPFSYDKNNEHVGFEDLKEDLLKHIQRENFAHIYGNVGSGKTSLLSWIEDQSHRFNSDIEIVHVDSSNISEEWIENIVSTSFLESLLGREKNHVFLIDNAQNLSELEGKKLEAAHSNGRIHSVVFSSIDSSLNTTESLSSRVGRRKHQIRTMTTDEAKQMVEKRLENKENPFSENVLEKIFKLANHHPRKILEYLETAAVEIEPPIKNPGKIAEVIDEEEARKKKKGLTRTDILEKLTDRQRQIIEEIFEEGSMDPEDIVEEGIGNSKGGIRPYFYQLADEEKMENRDIPLKLLEKNEETGKWNLTEESRNLLARN